MAEATRLRALRDEATARFVGRGAVVGAALGGAAPGGAAPGGAAPGGAAPGGAAQLTIFLARDDDEQKADIRAWAEEHAITLDFVVAGRFKGGAAA